MASEYLTCYYNKYRFQLWTIGIRSVDHLETMYRRRKPYIRKDCAERQLALRKIIGQDDQWSLDFSFRLKSRFLEGEAAISKTPFLALPYANRYFKFVGWPEAEPEILKDAWYSNRYATDVLKRRFEAGEPVILNSGTPELMCMYAVNVMENQWLEAEPYIVQISNRNPFRQNYESKFNVNLDHHY